MKNIILKFISCLLVVSICLSMTTEMLPAFTVSAASIELADDRTEEESIEDTKALFPAGDWDRAKKDLLVPPYSYFHKEVQSYISSKIPSGSSTIRTEETVTFKDGKIPPGHKTNQGSVDLYSLNTSDHIAYFWEVKPGSYLEPVKFLKGMRRLNNYAYDSIVKYSMTENSVGNIPYLDGKKSYLKGNISLVDFFKSFMEKPSFVNECGEDVDFELLGDFEISFDLTLDKSKQYQILIAYFPSGLVLYWFYRIPDSKLPDFQPDPSVFWWIVGSKLLDLLQDMMNNPDGYTPSGKSPVTAIDGPIINQPVVPNPGQYDTNPTYPEEKSPRPTYVWRNGAIVLLATGAVVFQAEYISAIRAYAASLKVMCEAQASGSLYSRKGTVSNWKYISAACTMLITALTTSVAVSANNISADSAVSEISSFRAVLDLFSDEVNYFNEQSGTEKGKCRRGWWDPQCWDGCTCEPSDPNESTCDDIEDDVENAGNTPAPRDPLVIDLGHEGILLTSVDNGVYFDLDNNGFAERTAWVGPEDGFLVLDRNGNGKIDNGGELFGDQVILKNGSKSESGFEALSEVDENNDGIIDINDNQFSSLMVWIDINQNGISEQNELTSLDKLSITSISLDYQEIGDIDGKTGTVISRESNVSFINDTTRKISEHWFKVNSRDSQDLHDYGDGVIVTSVESFGNIMSLNNAIFADETGELGRLVNEFKSSIDYVEKRVIIKRILYFITGAANIAPNSRGGNIDARDLHVIEQFMDENLLE